MIFCGTLTNSIAGHHYHGCSHMGEMSAMDSNQDGLITFDEFSAPHMEKYKRVFEMLDKDDDEVINEDEMNEFMKVHGYDKNLES
jgi:Ca2+-binding EF-hand superfamily protein